MMALTILITGGIGSGKSVVSGILRALGIPVYDTDSRTKALYEGELGMRLEEDLGQKLHTADGHFDRKAFAALIFSDRQVLDKVEEIVHPAVLRDFENWKEKQESQIVCMESAIALEKPLFNGSYDFVVIVNAPEDLRIRRACNRDGSDETSIRKRIQNQKVDLQKANFIIENDDGLDKLEAQTTLMLEAAANRILK